MPSGRAPTAAATCTAALPTPPAVAELTRKEHPDVALVGLGESSQHALELIEQIVRNAACPVILVLDARDQDFVNEAAQRGVFAHIVETDKNQLQSAIDITLRRFAEYHKLEEAFELLRDHSQRDGRKLVDIAEAVTQTHRLLTPKPGTGPEQGS